MARCSTGCTFPQATRVPELPAVKHVIRLRFVRCLLIAHCSLLWSFATVFQVSLPRECSLCNCYCSRLTATCPGGGAVVACICLACLWRNG